MTEPFFGFVLKKPVQLVQIRSRQPTDHLGTAGRLDLPDVADALLHGHQVEAEVRSVGPKESPRWRLRLTPFTTGATGHDLRHAVLCS